MLTNLLKEVSRSFYLTLRVLPAKVRTQIGLAYLLARATDTIADTEILPVAERLSALQTLRDRILGRSDSLLNFGEIARHQGSAGERVLLERCEDAIGILARQSTADQVVIRAVLETITSGQELDLTRFATASADHIMALNNEAELDDYTYRVAGCVGEFWTRICRAHLFPGARLDDELLMSNGIRFGKGLQMVNILRDIPADLRQGRCYLPLTLLNQAGLTPQALLDPASEPRLRPGYDRYLELAQSHLRAGWEYTNSLPWNQARVRLGCAWPVLIGLKTIDRLRSGKVLDASLRIKVTRPEIRNLMLRSVLLYPLPGQWRKMSSSQPAR